MRDKPKIPITIVNSGEVGSAFDFLRVNYWILKIVWSIQKKIRRIKLRRIRGWKRSETRRKRP
jgi:hypothetical protein